MKITPDMRRMVNDPEFRVVVERLVEADTQMREARLMLRDYQTRNMPRRYLKPVDAMSKFKNHI